MPRKTADVVTGLQKKGFEPGKKTHHKYYVYRTTDGDLSVIRTYISHSSKELSDSLLGQMAKQCKLKREEFLRLVDCTLDQEGYQALVQDDC